MRRPGKSLDIKRRQGLALTGEIKHLKNTYYRLSIRIFNHKATLIAANQHTAARRVKRFLRLILRQFFVVAALPVIPRINFAGIRLRFNTIDPLRIVDTYRFKIVAQLQQLEDLLQLPDDNIIEGSRVHGEEILLIALERCALGTRLIDLQAKYHIVHYLCGQIVTWFAQWIQDHWIWLIHDNLAYWYIFIHRHIYIYNICIHVHIRSIYIYIYIFMYIYIYTYLKRYVPANGQPNGLSLAEISANAIRNKLIDHYGQQVEPVCPDGFKIAFAVDCMITESLRIGGVTMTSGQFALTLHSHCVSLMMVQSHSKGKGIMTVQSHSKGTGMKNIQDLIQK
jgi:hypothetical protein